MYIVLLNYTPYIKITNETLLIITGIIEFITILHKLIFIRVTIISIIRVIYLV